jgi:succinate-semialdehyde dehydrogenase / glutarate-semialdehyde dehydrogenase
VTASIVTVNPATGRQLASYPAMTPEQIGAVLDTAAAAQARWAAEDFKVRGEVLRAAATQLRAGAEELALLVTREMGKPLVESRAEVEKCATGMEFYADHAHTFLADEIYDTSADRSWVSYEPVGIVLAIMPWNFPLWQVFRFAAPALMAGNAALLKHSPNTTGSAMACAQILRAAGLPEGLFTALLVAEADVPATTERLIADPRIGAVTITDSERARQRGRVDRRPGDQEIGPGTGRLGSVRGAGRRRSAAGGHPCGAGPVPQRRAELHLAETVHRGARRG